MNKNRLNFFIGNTANLIMLLLGVIYLTIPNYYGVENMSTINTGYLFSSITLIFSAISFAKFILLKNNPNNENLLFSILGSVISIITLVLSYKAKISVVLPIGMLLFVFGYVFVKLFTIDYYHDRQNAYYLVELMITLILFFVGIVTVFNLHTDSSLQTMVIGYFIIVESILEIMDNSLKCMLRAPRFFNNLI